MELGAAALASDAVEAHAGHLASALPGRVEVGVAAQEAPVESMLFVALAARAGHVEVEHEELGLLGAVAGPDRADQLEC